MPVTRQRSWQVVTRWIFLAWFVITIVCYLGRRRSSVEIQTSGINIRGSTSLWYQECLESFRKSDISHHPASSNLVRLTFAPTLLVQVSEINIECITSGKQYFGINFKLISGPLSIPSLFSISVQISFAYIFCQYPCRRK